MELDYVRVCPVCETENAPELARCQCGASLGGVDFSLRRPPAPRGPEANPSVPASADAPDVSGTAPARLGRDDAAVGAPSAITSPPSDVESVICPHPDCAQPNPPDRARCVYCNRPLRAEPSPAAAGARPLPSVLRDDYRVLDAFPATGSEADLLLVEHLRTGERCVAKLYRKGLEPDMRLLALLSRAEGDYVVRVRAYGVSDGIAYEVQEYLAHGTLRQLLQAGPLARDDVRRIVKELADALNAIHAQRILHRDLKPENVMVRSSAPLELALTDFGIASLREATQHFTGGARTAKYAAPEALTGVIDEKSDWWALGMIALEAATGRHPFDGLTEQVINHHLATRPVDVRAVYDDRLRALCRGLLLRDPKRRWGSSEVARWLDGDATLAAPDDTDGHATAVRPYRIEQVECTTASELALALARHWEAAVKDLARGQIARWLEHELHDYNLVRKLRDIADERGATDEVRLLRFLLVAVPDLPPVWRAMPVSRESLLDAARKAANADEQAESWLDSIARHDVLARFAAAGHADLGEFDRRWREAWAHFVELWKAAQAAEEAWRKQPKAVAGAESARVASFDDLMFSAPMWFAPPPQGKVNGALLLALTDTAYGDSLLGEVTGGHAEVAGFCPWYDALCDRVQHDAIGMLVAQRMLPHARDDAAMERRRQGASQGARERIIGEARERVRSRLRELLRVAPADDDLDRHKTAQLLNALGSLQEACHQASGLGFVEEEYQALCRSVEKLSAHALAAQQALARCEEVHGVNAIFMRPERLAIAGVIVAATLLLRVPWLILALIVAAACAAGYRWYLGFQATESALAALRLLRLHGNAMLRADVAS